MSGKMYEVLVLFRLLNAGKVQRRGRGLPKHRPAQLVGDRGYST